MSVRFTKKRIKDLRQSYGLKQKESADASNQKKQHLLSQDDIGWYSIDKAGHVAYFDTNTIYLLGKIPCCYFQLPFNDYLCTYKFTVESFVSNRKRFHPEWCSYFTPADGIFVYELEDLNGRVVKKHDYIRTIKPDVSKVFTDFPEETIKALSFTRYDGFYNEDELIKIEGLKFFHNPEWSLPNDSP